MITVNTATTPIIVAELLNIFKAQTGRVPGYRRDDDASDLLHFDADQAELDAALAAYDHQAVIAARSRAEGLAAAEKIVRPNLAAQATEATFETSLPVMAALLRAFNAHLSGGTPDPVDVAFLQAAVPGMDGLEAIFTDPATASMAEGDRPVYIAGQKALAAQARNAYAEKTGGVS